VGYLKRLSIRLAGDSIYRGSKTYAGSKQKLGMYPIFYVHLRDAMKVIEVVRNQRQAMTVRGRGNQEVKVINERTLTA
jgi:hypothetical protein